MPDDFIVQTMFSAAAHAELIRRYDDDEEESSRVILYRLMVYAYDVDRCLPGYTTATQGP